MSDYWLCANCSTVGLLNKQGMCGACGSSAVMPEAKLPVKPTETKPKKPRKVKGKDIQELERIYGKH